jgi:hypothetical protein
MPPSLERRKAPEGQFWVLDDSSARSLVTHIRNVEKHSQKPFRVRQFLDVGDEATAEGWLAAARRAEKRFKNSASTEAVRASTHLTGELLLLFGQEQGWRGVLNRLTVEALDGRVLDFSQTAPRREGFKTQREFERTMRGAVAREFNSLVRLADTVYASPDARKVIGYLFAQHGLPTDGLDEKGASGIDLEASVELESQRRQLEAEKRAEEERRKLDEERRRFEEDKKRRAEQQRQAEEEHRRQLQREEQERQRRAEQEHQRLLAEKEAIKPGNYMASLPALQLGGFVSTTNPLRLQAGGAFTYSVQGSFMGMMNVGWECSGQWEYDVTQRVLTLNGALRMSMMNQPGDIFSLLAQPSVLGAMPPQAIFMAVQITSYRNGQWDGHDQDRNPCRITRS